MPVVQVSVQYKVKHRHFTLSAAGRALSPWERQRGKSRIVSKLLL